MALSEKAQATRERILVAATELFYLHGFNATGLDKILKAADVTKGNFYYHFASKEALAIATLDWQFDLITEEIQTQVLSKKSASLNTLFALLRLMAARQKKQYKNGHICGCYFGNFTLELSTASQAIRDKVTGIFKQYLSLIESLLVKACDEGDVDRKINPKQMSAVILSQIEGAILLDKAKQAPKNVDGSIRFIKQVLQPVS